MTDLTEKELEELELEAALEVEAELKAEAREEAKASIKAKLKKEASVKEASKTPGKGTRMVMISLGKHSDRIVINGRTFMAGRSYPLTLDEERTIKDVAFRTHLHQAEIRGKNFLKDFYGARPTNVTI